MNLNKIIEFVLNSVSQDEKIRNSFCLVGLYFVAKFATVNILKILAVLRLYFIHPIFGKKINWRKDYGKWAVVTGATDGIGKEFAFRLAKDHMNVVLISRSLPKLQVVAKSIERKFEVKVRTIAIDFSNRDPEIYRTIEKELSDLEIGILVNNVGVYVPYPMPHGEFDPELLLQHATVNCAATTIMTRLVLPKMKERGKGGIINISSTAGAVPFQWVTSYSASKRFVDHFTEGVREEYKGCGITFLNLKPGYVATKMVDFNPRIGTASFFIPTAKQYVESAVHCFGAVETTTGYFWQSLQLTPLLNLPFGKWYLDRFHKMLGREGKVKNN